MSTHGAAGARPAGWTLTTADSEWPPLWRELVDPPAEVFGRGRRDCLAQPVLAIVGTRRATPRGMAVARGLAGALASAGWVIASGLARGIDAAAHAGALEAGGTTVAVMATGLDLTYPPAHVALRARIEARGCTVTELPPGTLPLPYQFPRRNRLVAGMARGVIVVEAPLRSGALGTAWLAADQNREVMAVPGPVDAPQSAGCHHLLKEGAALIDSVEDVHRLLPPPRPAPPDPQPPAATPLPAPGTPARWLWDRLDCSGVAQSELLGRWPGPASDWAEALVALEMAGLIRRLPGGRLARRIWRP